MNKTDYKAIAEIIRLTKNNSNRTRALELADYFEREDKDTIIDNSDPFDKEQFLKDCGVIE
ncbi:MAG: hypothetical protein ACTSX6_04700 [Candidatus Heimdallarchaeaceae archaeon]